MLKSNDSSKIFKYYDQYLKSTSEIIDSFLTEINSNFTKLPNSNIYKNGKMLRSLVLFITAGMAGEINKNDIRNSAIIEMIHNSSLIHDDVMDESDLRRGEVSLNNSIGNKYSVIIGDYFILKTLRWAEEVIPAEQYSLLKDVIEDMVVGQIYETQNIGNIKFDYNNYENIVKLKTAKLFALSSNFAFIGKNDNSNLKKEMYSIITDFGICFQISDDISDYTKSTNKLLKSSNTDYYQGKVTLPLILLKKYVSENEYCNLFNKRDENNLIKVKKLIENYSIIQECKYKMKSIYLNNLEEIELFSDSVHKKNLKYLFESVIDGNIV